METCLVYVFIGVLMYCNSYLWLSSIRLIRVQFINTSCQRNWNRENYFPTSWLTDWNPLQPGDVTDFGGWGLWGRLITAYIKSGAVGRFSPFEASLFSSLTHTETVLKKFQAMKSRRIQSLRICMDIVYG